MLKKFKSKLSHSTLNLAEAAAKKAAGKDPYFQSLEKGSKSNLRGSQSSIGGTSYRGHIIIIPTDDQNFHKFKLIPTDSLYTHSSVVSSNNTNTNYRYNTNSRLVPSAIIPSKSTESPAHKLCKAIIYYIDITSVSCHSIPFLPVALLTLIALNNLLIYALSK
ncbi:unnamed protein product [Schistosoma mattheei]|uniref:Uncharacterized protein n=1 Tax=Schistosoma mattheei TaxID=31246 RepID=A0A183PBW7_9TREM|nr:unnamed protein product [Schistosoma mattheei]